MDFDRRKDFKYKTIVIILMGLTLIGGALQYGADALFQFAQENAQLSVSKTNHSQQLNNHESKLNNHSTKISELKRNLVSFSSSVNNIKNDLAQMEKDINDLSKSVTTLRENVAVLQRRVKTLNQIIHQSQVAYQRRSQIKQEYLNGFANNE